MNLDFLGLSPHHFDIDVTPTRGLGMFWKAETCSYLAGYEWPLIYPSIYISILFIYPSGRTKST